MIGIIIVGHGEFAKGINSVIELIAGPQESLEVIEFLQGHSSEDLRDNIKESIERLETKQTLIFSDIPGGTPFKESAVLSTEYDGVEVIAGTNIPMLLEILFDREDGDIVDLKERALNTGKEQILSFNLESEEDDEDGI